MSDGAKAATTTAGATCLLLVGDRVVLRASGPPEAEYGMFEIGEIELRASEPGRVREHGYQTTVGHAQARLANFGINVSVARELALAMQPVLSEAYARGGGARRVARYLGPLELFQSEAYDGGARVYRGVFLDLAALARDLGLDHAGSTIHALYLAALLATEDPETTVLLSTDACTKGGKPGARTYKRPVFVETHRLLNALGGLAHRRPTPQIEETLPRADVIAFLRARADAAPDGDARDLYRSLETTVSLRDMPEKGPLASPDLWAIETRLEAADLDGIMQAVDEAERLHGRTPGTTYLRARASLALRLEPAKLIAEKVSALALSMTSFQELALLSAESWLDAGDPRRAMPYARDLVDSPGVDEGLLLRAQRLLARAVGAAPQRQATAIDVPAAAMPSRPPDSLSSPDAAVADAPALLLEHEPIPQSLEPDDLVPEPETPPPHPSPVVPLPPLPSVRVPPTVPSSRPSPQRPARPFPSSGRMPVEVSRPPTPERRSANRVPVAPPRTPAASRRLPSPAPVPPPSDPTPFGGGPLPDLDFTPSAPVASFTLDLPGPEANAPPTEEPPRTRARISGVMKETRPSSSFDPRAEPDAPAAPKPARDNDPHERPTPLRPPSGGPPRAALATPLLDAADAAPAAPTPEDTPSDRALTYMHGASLPPYRHESPPPLLPKAPLLPRLGGAVDELAEHLALPPGVGGEQRSLDVPPSSVLEARVQFTLLARELGLDYRLKRGIELRADVSGIEAMQSVLLETFPDHTAKTSDEGYELRRHGALLSEILARRLEAEWLDISSNELGYWVMIVPPDTRVWPFGRVARLVAMGHKERDLVSYFLELQARARGR